MSLQDVMASSVEFGTCAMRGSCGTKGWFGKPLPCPYDGSAQPPEDEEARSLLTTVCGPEYAEGPVCCTKDQVETLYDNLKTAEGIISSCPACRNNFRSFYCTFTCSPDQGTFLNVTSTQKSRTGETAVKAVDFFVGQRFAEGFFDSCKNVQFGASNGYAMDFIGGGAKDYKAFLKFMGDEKDLGSPFQINYPSEVPDNFTALDPIPRSCADNDLSSRCTCIDCPDVCSTLPYVPPPGSEPSCHVGVLSCLSFVLILAYCLAVAGFSIGYLLQLTIRRRREKKYERLVLGADAASETNHPLSPRSGNRGLLGASSLAQYVDGEESTGAASSEESRHHLGRGASLLDPMDTVQPRQYRLNNVLRRFFYQLGFTCATSPWLTLSVVFLLVGLLNLGWTKFQVETEPVRLWVAPDSESKLQKEYFDEHFGPFYRPEQIFVTSVPAATADSAPEKPPVLSWSHLKYWSRVEQGIRSLRSPSGYSLEDVCFKPAGPDGACVVQSALAWFGEDISDYDENTWAEHLLDCANSPVDCLPDYQQPLKPEFVLGAVPETGDGKKDYLKAEALVVTFVVSDSLDPAVQERATEWERTLRKYLLDVTEQARQEAGLAVSFSTGVSLEEEINKSTNMDVKIVVLSYLAMFFYVSIALGNGVAARDDEGVVSSLARWARNFPKLFRPTGITSSSLSIDSRETPRLFPRLPRKLFVGSKFTLGLFGIALVILSVSTSVGFFSLLGVKVTLIIAEVIPFLVLAVGVDNVFILVHELDRQNLLHGPNAAATTAAVQGSSNEYATTPMSPTRPENPRSPFAASHDESVDAASMPLYLRAEERVARTLAKMGPSILLSTVTETVAFALGALVPMPAVRNFALYAAGSVLLNALLQVTVFISALVLDLRRMEANRVDCFPCIKLHSRVALLDAPSASHGLGSIARFIRRRYAAFLLRPVVKGVVLLTFGGLFVASVISIQHMQLGLDQRLALPSESYLIPYFNDLDAYLDVGPPVYFVSHDVDVTQRPGQQALCGRFTTCNESSLVNVLEAERNRPESSFIAEPSASWIDDFLRWLDPAQEECCRVLKRNTDRFCTERDSSARCQPCFAGRTPAWNITMEGLPEGNEFMKYLNQWLISPTNQDCPLAGKASFGMALSLSETRDDVIASHFRTFHKPLKSQEDFINSFAAARRIADDISERTGTKVFPYSLHYVFFDQYAHIVAIMQEILGLGLGSVLLVTALLLGSWRTGTIVTGVVALTVVTVMGVMGLWGISLNAISLVNLVISLGIAVEFCAHVARAFMSAGTGLPADHPAGQKERDERMWTALVDVGPSVLSGITFTKLIGMAVLGLTRSRLLEIYYFRMWLTLIISGALHGLVLLPVVLSLAGGPGYPTQEADEEWMSNAMRNDYEYAPFLADDESVMSD
ncbi:multidrug efflux transporter AcrB transmembrane domain-containing protein [Gloeophyllum trabeum ATCC 11539]|uniref:Multidrug efflux transporter AcrB transmembrane domain-containing protein n=1 Tax=Gloeophyllum trabeum (strain ATCC 11539 / FP-39264 / Madison 617) TaxID=670483 RepID=S7QJ37_GLOTA|nr:multidrug efflux transporter AcrB transmembrane domain-containing protein [Gloeophyllum trabeum ATCC 11539]EPQ59387.1 multidrug efflux transporter AcrB transmembrane domain-containing protein [Gloeophyllum trabeum ATCC 11539]